MSVAGFVLRAALALLLAAPVLAANGNGNGKRNGNGNGKRNGNGNGNGNGNIRVRGSMRAAFEDYQIELPAGTTHHSRLTQTYAANMNGPLGLPGLGTATAAVNYSTGDSLSRLYAGGPSKEQTLGTTLTANMLPDQFGGFLSVVPFASRMEHKLAGAASEETETETIVGGSVGFRFPALPSVSVEVRKHGRVEQGRMFPNNTDSLDTHVRAGYIRGPLRLDVDRQGRATTEARTGLRQYDHDTLTTNASLDLPEVGRFGIQGVSAQAAYTGGTSRFPAPGTTRGLSAGTRATTQGVAVAGLNNHASYGPTYLGDLMQDRHFVGHDLSLFSSATRKTWNVSNQVQVTNAPGRMTQHNTLAERISGEMTTGDRRWTYRASAGETLRWGGLAPSVSSDSVSHRVSWCPVSRVDAYTDQGYGASRQNGTGTTSRGFSAGAGVNWRPLARLEVGPAYDRTWMRDFLYGRDSVRDTVMLSVRSSPVDRLSAGLTGRLELSDTARVPGARDRYGSASMNVSYRPFTSLDLSVRVTRYEQRTEGGSSAGAFETSGSVGWNIGRTSASIGWETRKLSIPNAYRHVTASLTRSF